MSYFLILLISLLPIISSAQLIIDGATLVNSNSVIDINGMSFYNQTKNSNHGHIISSGKIYCEGNWTNNITGGQLFDSSASSGEVIFDGGSDLTISGRETHFHKLSIDPSTAVNIAAGNLIKVYDTLNNNGTFILKTNSNRTAALIDAGDQNMLAGSGSYQMERYIAKSGWHYISSPLTNSTSSTNTFLSGALYYYNATSQQWIAKHAGQSMVIMRGYDTYFAADNKTVTFSGTFNTGSQQISLTGANNGWNFVGNPYPCTIDWKSLSGWTKTNVDDAIYLWDPTLNNGQGDYAEFVNNVANRGGSRFIPATQGFWVKCNNASGGTLGVNNAVKCNKVSTHFRSSDTKEIIRLNILQGNSLSQTTLYFENDAHSFFEKDKDAIKIIDQNANIPQLYTVASDSTPLAINALSTEIISSAIIPLSFIPYQSSNSTIEIDLKQFNFNNSIYLFDKQLNTFTDLRSTTSYTFSSSINDHPDRFLLYLFEPKSISNYSGVKELNQHQSLTVYQDQLIINTTHQLDLQIYSLVGKLVFKNDHITTGVHSIHTGLAKGWYIARLQSSESSISQKIFIP